MSTPAQRRLDSGSLALLLLAFIAAVIISNQVFSGWRIDFTENNLYTLSPGTKRILEKIEEPINLHFYYSDKATENLPSLRSYANRVREMLEEIEDRAGGMIDLRVIDPVPFSEEEDRAAQFGLQGIRLASSPDPVYLGLAATNSVGDEANIPFFQPDKEEFLEYDVAKLVSTLAQPGETVIGTGESLPLVRIQSSTRARAFWRASTVSAARRWRSQPKPCSTLSHSSVGGSTSKGERPPTSTTWPENTKTPP
jgi:ABC-type uncharacterized transport system involved in gliding motility auxiliary subunit